MRACGAQPEELRSVKVFASHEGLLLEYEDALTRTDPISGRDYATSGHLLWLGERTRELDGAQVAYLANIANPIAVKLSPSATPDQVRSYVDVLDPDRRPGRLTFITRMGAGNGRDRLPALVWAVEAEQAPVAWVCDPMHGNIFTSPSGHKTRLFADILDEAKGFFEVHRALGYASRWHPWWHPRGVHRRGRNRVRRRWRRGPGRRPA
jgi:3-deoxy-7-phosphoheptulonate synthase